MRIKIGEREIGEGQPVFIIAEIGINHNGDVGLAKRLVDCAVEAGVDAVKFQKRDLNNIYKEEVLNNTEKSEQSFQYMIPILKEVELKEKDYFEIVKYCEDRGITFLCTPWDTGSADFVHDLGVKAFKVASADMTNFFLISHLIKKGRPLIVSTGMSYWGEIIKTAMYLKKHSAHFALLHCNSTYPVAYRDINLKVMRELRRFGVPVGYSGHERGITAVLAAVSMGASIIEKHFTLNRRMKGPDHRVSLEPDELGRMAKEIRLIETSMGDGEKRVTRGEVLNRDLFGKSLVATRYIQKGTMISNDMVICKSPGKGLSPQRINEIIGKRALRDIPKDTYFFESDLKPQTPRSFRTTMTRKWALIARFNDVEEMKRINPPMFEFHFTDRDVGLELSGSSFKQELTVHAPEYWGDLLIDLCSANNERREKSVEVFQRTIDVTHRLAESFKGKPRLIFHPGGMSIEAFKDPKLLEENFLDSLERIDSRGIELLPENLPPFPWYFGGQWRSHYFMDAAEIRDFCEGYGYNICLDISHAKLYCNVLHKDILEYIRTVKPYIRHIHIADALGLDGEGIQIGDGEIDFPPVLDLLKDYEYGWVPEIWQGHHNNGSGFLIAIERIEQMLKKIK